MKIIIAATIAIALHAAVFGIIVYAKSKSADDIDQTIYDQALVMSEAYNSEDWNTVVKYTYPELVRKMGGKETMINVLREGMKKMNAEGAAIIKVEIEHPKEKVKTKKYFYAIVQQKLTIKVPGGLLHQKAHLLGISSDEGKNWTFLDTTKLDKKKLQRLLPDWKDEIKIPSRTKPTFEKH